MEEPYSVEDTDLRLAPSPSTTDDENFSTTHGPRLRRGLRIVQGESGELRTPFRAMPHLPGGLAIGWCCSSDADVAGRFLAIHWRRSIPESSRVATHIRYPMVDLDQPKRCHI